MAKFMYFQVIKTILAIISIVNYVALTCDEVSTVE